MTEPQPGRHRRRWRILVLGNSVALMALGQQSRLDGPYAGVLEEIVRASGLDVEVRNAGRWYEFIDEGMVRFVEEERAFSPDVVIVQYGINECQPRIVPRWLYGHVTTWNTGLRRPSQLYREHVLSPAWKHLRRWQRLIATNLGQRTWRMQPDVFAANLRRLVDMARYDCELALVLDVNQPGARLEHFLPGLRRRRDRYQQVIAGVVASAADPDVRLVGASSVVDEMGDAAALPDGLHWSPAAHRRVAEVLAAEIVPWLTDLERQSLGADADPAASRHGWTEALAPVCGP